MQVGELYAKLGLDMSSFEKNLGQAQNKLKAMGDKMTGVGKTMSAAITLPLAGLGAASFKLASDMEEAINKVDVAFGSSADEVKAWSETTLKSFGIAQGTALDMAALFGDMSTSMGLSTTEAEKMSTSLVGLAGDLASFKNIGIEQAETALKGIFTGETESLKELGIVMTQANLELFAMEKGYGKTVKEMTEAEKVQLRYAYVLEKTKNAHGDFTRTGDGAANQMRIFSESLKELGATLGQNLLPIITPIITKINEWVQKFGELDSGTQKTILIIAGIAAAIGPALIAIGSLASAFTNLVPAIKAVGTALNFLGANPIVLIIAAVIALAYLIITNWDTIKEVTIRVWGAVKEFLIKTWNSITEKVGEIWNGLKDFFTGLWDSIKEIFDSALNKIKELFYKYHPVGIVIAQWDEIKQVFSDAWGKIKEIVSAGLQKIKDAFLRYTPVGIVISQWDEIIRFLKTIPSKMLELGKNIVQDLINGIKAKATALKNAVKETAGNVGNWFKEKLGIHSPSVVFRKLGMNLGEGLAIGLNDSAEKVKKAVSNMTALATPEIAGYGNISNISSSISSTQRIEHTGTLRVEGVNSKGELVGVTDIIYDDILSRMARELRT